MLPVITGQLDDPNGGVMGIGLQYFKGSIPAAVVNQDDFIGPVQGFHHGLGTLHKHRDVLLFIIYRYHEGYHVFR